MSVLIRAPIPRCAFLVLEILDEEFDQSAPELAEELQARVDHPDDFGEPVLAQTAAGWLGDRLAPRCGSGA